MTVKYRVPIPGGEVATRTSRAHRIAGDHYRFIATHDGKPLSWHRQQMHAHESIRTHRTALNRSLEWNLNARTTGDLRERGQTEATIERLRASLLARSEVVAIEPGHMSETAKREETV